MIRGAGGAVVVAVAALLVSCSADSHQEQANEHGMDQYNSYDERTRNLYALGGGQLIQRALASQHSPDSLYTALRRMYGRQDQWPARAAYANNYRFDKRNFDEIDRSDLNTFIGKRNFDEIDQTLMPFPYASKRFFHRLYQNYLDSGDNNGDRDQGSNTKRSDPDANFDEIDQTWLPIGSKRAGPVLLSTPKRLHGAVNSLDRIG